MNPSGRPPLFGIGDNIPWERVPPKVLREWDFQSRLDEINRISKLQALLEQQIALTAVIQESSGTLQLSTLLHRCG
jgi:hypothetical protein